MDHPPGCRCPSCHPFAPGSDAEAAWLAGDRTDPTRVPPRPRVIPSPASYLLPVLPGDLEVLAARVECARALGLPIPARAPGDEAEAEDSQPGENDAIPPS